MDLCENGVMRESSIFLWDFFYPKKRYEYLKENKKKKILHNFDLSFIIDDNISKRDAQYKYCLCKNIYKIEILIKYL